jgi:hypothetical protein
MIDPYAIAVPLVTLVFALYGSVMRLGVAGYIGGAVAGAVWCVLAGFAARWLERDPSIAALSADLSLLGCIAVGGLLTGSSGLYVLVFRSVLRESSTTYDVLSAMMKPTVPFYIAINSAMEVLFLPLVLFLNWSAEPTRRWTVLTGSVVYIIQRAWTYLVYAERRLATGTQPLSEADIRWYRRTLAADYRFVLNAIVFVVFATVAFFRPVHA